MIVKTQKEKLIDGLGKRHRPGFVLDYPLFQYVKKYKKGSVFYSPKYRTDSFFTNDSGLYFFQDSLKQFHRGTYDPLSVKKFDSLNYRNLKIKKYSVGKEDLLYLSIKRKYSNFQNYLQDKISGTLQNVSLAKAWNVSLVGSILFGMLTMTMIYRYLGQGVSAKSPDKAEGYQKAISADSSVSNSYAIAEDGAIKSMAQILGESQSQKEKDLKEEIMDMVKGYPIEKMVPEIAKRDRIVAAFIIGIAKKESDWGKHVPVYKGEDCYNYWGFKAQREKMGTGGHTCFDSPKDAVDSVANRIEKLVEAEKLNTPEKMKVWKCGYDCSWDSKTAVNKWVSDVDMYFKKINK